MKRDFGEIKPKSQIKGYLISFFGFLTVFIITNIIATQYLAYTFWVQIKICTKTDTDSLSRLNSSFSLALNHSSSSSYINLLL